MTVQTYVISGGATIKPGMGDTYYNETGDPFNQAESSITRVGEGSGKTAQVWASFHKFVLGPTGDQPAQAVIPPGSTITSATLSGVAALTATDVVNLRIACLDRVSHESLGLIGNAGQKPTWMRDQTPDLLLASSRFLMMHRIRIGDGVSNTVDFNTSYNNKNHVFDRRQDGVAGAPIGFNDAGFMLFTNGLGAFTFNQVEVSVAKTSGTRVATGNLEIRVYDVGSAAGFPIESVLADATLIATSAPIDLTAVGVNFPNTETFSFSPNVSLLADRAYVFLISGDWARDQSQIPDSSDGVPMLGFTDSSSLVMIPACAGRTEGMYPPIMTSGPTSPIISPGGDTLNANVFGSVLTFNGVGNWTAGFVQNFDVTTLVQEWVNDPDYLSGDPIAFTLDPLTSTQTGNSLQFLSDNDPVGPGLRLVVDFVEGLPVVDTFTATPAVIDAGDPVTLAWTTTMADSVTLDQGIGSVPVDGTTVVAPIRTTTYGLTATNAFGTVTKYVTVIVRMVQSTVYVEASESVVVAVAVDVKASEVVSASERGMIAVRSDVATDPTVVANSVARGVVKAKTEVKKISGS